MTANFGKWDVLNKNDTSRYIFNKVVVHGDRQTDDYTYVRNETFKVTSLLTEMLMLAICVGFYFLNIKLKFNNFFFGFYIQKRMK